jgi:LysR family transcriptional regulator, hydrogen peroxide-inducible genes activator
MKPTLKQLEYLIALKNEASFSRAAERCFVTQSTLSAGIKELENITGQTLVDRSSRLISLTPIGERIYSSALKISAETDKIMAIAHIQDDPLSGLLRLGVIPTIAPYMLPHILPPLHKTFPSLDLQLFEDLTDRLIDKLMRRKLDLLLMAFPYENEEIEKIILFEEPFVIAMADKQYNSKSVSLDFLDDKNVLLLEDGHCLRDHALKACKLQKNSHKKTFSATSLSTLIQMISAGYGLTLLPQMAANIDNLPSQISIIRFNDPQPTRQIGLAWRKGAMYKNDYLQLAKFLGNLQY